MANASNILHIPLIATEQYVKAFGHTVADIALNRVKNYHLLEKKKFSMMTDDLDKLLLENEMLSKRKCVILYGIETHVCVQQTALDLLERDYEVHVLADGVSSQRATDREIALDRLRQSGVFVTTCESAMFMLTVHADQPYFKELSSLFNNSKNPRPPAEHLL
jgi:nicotinamidase-related amidase